MRRALIFSILLSFVFSQDNYDTKIQPIFDANCTSCHGNSSDLNLEQGVSYDNMVNQSSSYGGFIVNPGDKGSSSLYQKLVGNGSYGSRMPQGGQLEQSYIDIIGQWIDSGAPKEFGNNTTDGNPYTIDEFRISNVARTDDNTYPSAKPVSDGNTILLYHFDENDGSNSIVDASSQNNNGKVEGSGVWEPGVFGRAYDFELGSPVTFNPYNSGMVQQGNPGIADWTIDFFMLLHQFNNEDRRPIFEYDDDQGAILYLDLQRSSETYSLLFFQTGMSPSGEEFKFDILDNIEPDGYFYIKISHASSDNTLRVFVSGKTTSGGNFSHNLSKSTTGIGIPSGDNSFHIGSYSDNGGGGDHNLALGGNVFSEHIELTWNPYNGDDFHQYELKHHNNDNITLGGPGTVILGPSDNASKDVNTSVWTHNDPKNGMNYYKLFVLDDTFNQVAESNTFSLDFSGGGGGTGENLPIVISISGVQNGLNGQIFVNLHKASDDDIVDTKNVGETTPINNKKINFNIDQNKVTNGQSYYITATFEVNAMVEAAGQSLDFNWPPTGDISLILEKGTYTGPFKTNITVHGTDESGILSFRILPQGSSINDYMPDFIGAEYSYDHPQVFSTPPSDEEIEINDFLIDVDYGMYPLVAWYNVGSDDAFDPDQDPFAAGQINIAKDQDPNISLTPLSILPGPEIVSNNLIGLTPKEGEDLSFSINVNPHPSMLAGTVSQVSLIYFTGHGNFRFTDCSNSTGDTYDCLVPGSDMTNSGLVIGIDAFDNYGATSSAGPYDVAVQFDSIYISSAPAERYIMISVPANLSNPSLANVLGDELGEADATKWRSFKWVNGAYQENAGSLTPGSAVWLISKENVNAIQAGSGYSTALSMGKTISLSNGWNQIGNPYNFPINIDDQNMVQFSSEVEKVLYQYSGGENYSQTTNLDPGTGYWVYSNGSGSINISPINNADPHAQPSSPNLVSKSQGGWQATLEVAAGNQKDKATIFGMHPESSDGYDKKDFHEPPVIGEYISAYFNHPEIGNLNNDMRSESQDVTRWPLSVITNQKGTVKMTIPDIERIPNYFEVMLYDPISKVVYDMRQDNLVRISSQGSENPYPLELILGPFDKVEDQLDMMDIIPSAFQLAQNIPNPFNPVTSIRVSLTEQAVMTLKVYNILGIEMNALAVNQLFSKGNHRFLWEGKDDNGRQLPSGIYLYRLTVSSENGLPVYQDTKKMILMK